MTFTNFADNEDEYWRRGIIQICLNNAWGTVCSDNLFDNTDAEVFCGQLKGFNSTGMDSFELMLIITFHVWFQEQQRTEHLLL